MWSTLKTDLKEFVTTVTDESTNVLDAIDSKLQENEAGEGGDVVVSDDGNVIRTDELEATGIIANARDEAARRQMEEETYLEPLIVETQVSEEQVAQGEEDGEEEASAEGAVGDAEDGDEEASEEGTDADEFKEEREFLANFDLEAKTEEIAKLLEDNPDTLKPLFELLVPTQVTYEEFWQRHYYRCDEERIVREWKAEQQEAREARAKALQGGIASVKNLWGGAVQAVSNKFESTEGAEEEEDTSFEFHTTQPQPTQGGIGAAIFGSGIRPPFVMNTAVSEDDEEAEEEEEEELGWDDDDDELYEDDEEEEEQSFVEGDSEEQIEFSESMQAEITKLREELAQVVEEREMLHQTVEMQSKAIADLKENGSDVAASSNDEELEKLKMALFEKDSELAALKASLDDDHEDTANESEQKEAVKVTALEREVERLTQDLAISAEKASRLEEELKQSNSNLEQLHSHSQVDKASLEELRNESQTDKSALKEALSAKVELQSRVASLEDALAKCESKRVSAESTMGVTASQLAAAQQEFSTARANAEMLTAKVKEIEGDLEVAGCRAEQLDQELAAVRQELEQKQSEVAALSSLREKSAPSPVSSASSGIKVPAATPAIVPDRANDDDDNDGWGDDWSDED